MKRRKAAAAEGIAVAPEDLWFLLLASTRYALGRASYATSLVPDLVLRYAAGLAPLKRERLRQIAEEIDVERKIREIPDGSQWTRYAERIRAEAER